MTYYILRKPGSCTRKHAARAIDTNPRTRNTNTTTPTTTTPATTTTTTTTTTGGGAAPVFACADSSAGHSVTLFLYVAGYERRGATQKLTSTLCLNRDVSCYVSLAEPKPAEWH